MVVVVQSIVQSCCESVLLVQTCRWVDVAAVSAAVSAAVAAVAFWGENFDVSLRSLASRSPAFFGSSDHRQYAFAHSLSNTRLPRLPPIVPQINI